MPIKINKTDGELTIELEGAVTIRHCQNVAAQISEALESGASITVGTAGLEDVDTSILQLLSSLHKTVPLLVFKNPSDIFIAAVDRCGLRRELLNGTREGI